MLEALLTGKAPKPGLIVVPSNQFITASVLTELVGMDPHPVKGSFTTDADNIPWLLLEDGGKKFMIPKRPLRHTIGWAALGDNGLVLGKEITIRGAVWKIRLMTGFVPGNEWDRYMYGICVGASPVKRYATYTYAELGMDAALGDMAFISEDDGTMYRMRGVMNNMVYSAAQYKTNVWSRIGWRPILEYVSGPIPW